MPAKFDRKAYQNEIANDTLDSIQDRVMAIDERTYTDVHRRKVLVEERTKRAVALAESQNTSEPVTEHWAFSITYAQKPSVKELASEERDVFEYIIEKHLEMLGMSKDDLIEVCKELEMSPEATKLLLAKVCEKAAPTVKAKPINN